MKYVDSEGTVWSGHYTHFVMTRDGQIESGWEFQSDAKDRIKELRASGEGGMAVYSAKFLLGKGVLERSNTTLPSGTNMHRHLREEHRRVLAERDAAWDAKRASEAVRGAMLDSYEVVAHGGVSKWVLPTYAAAVEVRKKMHSATVEPSVQREEFDRTRYDNAIRFMHSLGITIDSIASTLNVAESRVREALR